MPKIKVDQPKDLKSLKRRKRASGSFIQNVPNEADTGSIVVRFLTEPQGWVGFWEYWDEDLNTFVPVVEGEEVEKPSERRLAAVLDVNTDEVKLLKLPVSLVDPLVTRAIKYGTIMDRDYELWRSGKGFDTSYDYSPEEKIKRNLKKYKIPDLVQALVDYRERALSSNQEEDTPKKTKKVVKKKKKKEKPF